MKKIVIDGKRYMGLGDFDNLRYNLVRDIYDRYEKDDSGQIHLSEFDEGQIAAYTHMMSVIMEEEVHDAESPDEIREMRRSIMREWLRNKYCIVGKDEETGEKVYFRKFCEHVNEGEETPVFTSKRRLAATFDDYYVATCTMKRIEVECEMKGKLDTKPLCLEYLGKEETERLLNAIFGKDNDDKEQEQEV